MVLAADDLNMLDIRVTMQLIMLSFIVVVNPGSFRAQYLTESAFQTSFGRFIAVTDLLISKKIPTYLNYYFFNRYRKQTIIFLGLIIIGSILSICCRKLMVVLSRP